MTTVEVNSTAQLTAALKKATANETIELDPGSYAGVTISGVNVAGLVITSTSTTAQAVLTGLSVKNSSGITLQNMQLSAATTPVGVWGGADTFPFQILSDSGITLNNLTFSGATNVTLANAVVGLNIENSQNITVTNSSFAWFNNDINTSNVTGLNISNNSFNYNYQDNIRGYGDSSVTIDNNYFTNNDMDPTSPAHPDCIQFWSSGATASATNITISGNTYVRGDLGNPVQGVWIDDDAGNLPFKNVTITDNSFSGTLLRGISVVGGQSLVITDNTVTAYTDQVAGIVLQNDNYAVVGDNQAQNFVYNNDTNFTTYNDVVTKAIPVPTPATTSAAPSTATLVAAMASMPATDASVSTISSSAATPTAVMTLASPA